MAASILARIRDAQNPSSLIQTTMQNLHDGLQRLDVVYAVTGRAARYEIGVGVGVSKITIALVNHDASPEIVAKKLAEMSFDDRQPFALSESGQLTYKDPRFFSTTPDHRIVLFSVSSLPLASQIRFHKTRLAKSKQGWNMVSPFFLLLDYLIKAMKRIQRYIELEEATVQISESADGSRDLSVLSSPKASQVARHVRMLIEQQSPGNPADKEFLEDCHFEAVTYISSFVPEIRSFPPFEHIFAHTAVESTTKPEPRFVATHTHLRHSASATPTPTSPPMSCSSRNLTPESEEIECISVQTDDDAAYDSDDSMEPPSVKYVPEEPAPCPLKSVRWAAETAICTILLTGLSPALMGSVANMLYGAPTVPSTIEIAVYTPPKAGFSAQTIKDWIVTQDPKNFRMVHKNLFCCPAESLELGFKFVAAGQDGTRSMHGYRIDIVLPATAPLPHFHPESLNHTQWVQMLPVVPFGLALLHELKLWFVAVHENKPIPVQEEHADSIFAMLEQHKYRYFCETKPWDDATILDKDLRKRSRNRARAYTKMSVHGPASRAAWNRLGLL